MACLNLLGGLVLAAATLLSQAPVPKNVAPVKPPAPSLRPGKVEGVVTNSLTGLPVRKATVTSRNYGSRGYYIAAADTAGHFLIENVEPGQYLLSAESSGFMTAPRTTSAVIRPVTVNEEEHVKNISITLVPLATVSGRVLDMDGDPIPGAAVQVIRSIYINGSRQMQSFGAASTNDLGEYQIIDVAPGRYYLQASPSSNSLNVPTNTRWEGAELAYPNMFSPGVRDITEAAAIDVAPGAHLLNMDFNIRKLPSVRIRGRVLDGTTGQPALSVNTRLETRGNGTVRLGQLSARASKDGTFEMRNVPAGSYTIAAEQYGARKLSARIPVEVGNQDLNNVLITLTAGAEISGVLVFEGSTPTRYRGQLALVVAGNPMGGYVQTQQFKEDGTFVLHDVFPGIYQLTVNPPPQGKYIKSIRMGEQDFTSGRIDLAQPGAAALTVTFGSDPGQVQGVVMDAKGDSGLARIVLAPRDGFDDRLDLVKIVTAGAKGVFKVSDVAPGDYRVFAFEELDPNILRSAEFRKLFESRSVSVLVHPASQETVQIKAISAEEIALEKTKLP